MKYHYVYIIENKKNKMKYGGVHTCVGNPVKDIGINYFGSSKHLTKKEQKSNISEFDYIVIETFKSRLDAEIGERKMLIENNAASSELWYNKCNGFKSGNFNVLGKMPVRCQKTGKMIGCVDINHLKVLSGEWAHHSKGSKSSKETIKAISKVTSGSKNPNYSGISDEEIIDYYLELTNTLNRIPSINILRIYVKKKYNRNIPKYFTKFRFTDKNLYLIIEEKTGLQYNPYYRSEENRKKISETLKGRKRSGEHNKKSCLFLIRKKKFKNVKN